MDEVTDVRRFEMGNFSRRGAARRRVIAASATPDNSSDRHHSGSADPDSRRQSSSTREQGAEFEPLITGHHDQRMREVAIDF